MRGILGMNYLELCSQIRRSRSPVYSPALISLPLSFGNRKMMVFAGNVTAVTHGLHRAFSMPLYEPSLALHKGTVPVKVWTEYCSL